MALQEKHKKVGIAITSNQEVLLAGKAAGKGYQYQLTKALYALVVLALSHSQKKKSAAGFQSGSYGRWKSGTIKLESTSIARVQMSNNMVLNWVNEVEMHKGQARDLIRRQN